MKQELQALLTKSDEEIQALIKEEQQKLKDAKKAFQLTSKEMEEQHNALFTEKTNKIKEINESGLGIAKSIKTLKEKQQGYGSNGEEL